MNAVLSCIAESTSFSGKRLRIAQGNLFRWRQHLDQAWINEWEALLNGPFDKLLSFLRGDQRDSDRLQPSSPFCWGLVPTRTIGRLCVARASIQLDGTAHKWVAIGFRHKTQGL